MTQSLLIKTELHSSVAESIFKEITSKSGRYYYFLSSVIDWDNPEVPPYPIDSPVYEREVRKDMVMVKEIQPGDVAFVIDRVQWESNVVYDMWDDSYSTQVIGIDLQNGGSNYTSNANITISGGGGSGATANLVIDSGSIAGINLIDGGIGYTTTPNVIIQDSFGSGAVATAVLNYSYSGSDNIEGANFYVMTDEWNVYKCLDNNDNSLSLDIPSDITPEPFTTNDGYKWKYIATIPVSLRNKFATSVTIPITNILTDQFYSGGQIKNVNILNSGNNYSFARIQVQGDGYLEDNPYVITTPFTANVGSGYSEATLIIDPPISDTPIEWTAESTQYKGRLIIHDNNYYRVIQAGTTADYPPVHTIGIAQNGTTGLKFIGTRITANANISGGTVVGFTDLNGSLYDITLSSGGSGYTNPPEISFIDGGGSNAAAYATIVDGTINRIVFSDYGSGYDSVPTVKIGTEWEANANVIIGDQIFNSVRLYTVTGSGMLNVTAPVHTTGEETYGTANLTYAGIAASGTARLKYGAGYSRAPGVIVNGDGNDAVLELQGEKTEAIIYPYIEDGSIKRAIIEDGGIGYTSATLTVIGDGNDAEVTVDFSVGDLITIQSTSELLAVDGAIHAIKVTSGGYGYVSIPTITIDGDGTGATAIAETNNGRVSRIIVTNEGSGYTTARITITGTGKGASARAILPPLGGHGSDPSGELFARTVVFYTIISNDKNHGLVVDNDFRQFGIIKDIRNYANDKYFTGALGSSTWLISGTIDTSKFKADDVLYRVSDNSRFQVIQSTVSSMLIIPLDGKTPLNSNVLRNAVGDQFTITGVESPDVNRYSGKMLYIDNRKAFSPSEEQAVSIKTNLRF